MQKMILAVNIWEKNKMATKKFQRNSTTPILVISGQKTGTHLLTAILNEIGFIKGNRKYPDVVSAKEFSDREPYEFIISHKVPERDAYALIAAGKLKTIFNYRDPRDVIVSNYYWTQVVTEKDLASPEAQYIREFRKQIHQGLGEKQKSFKIMIQGHRLLPGEQGLHTWFREPIGLLLNPLVYKTNFEGLVGSAGGGSDETQREMIAGLINFLEINENPDDIVAALSNRETKTFRSGKIGSYKDEFSIETKETFDKHYGDILDLYGYSR
jgi:hypothetical protein